MRKNNDSQPEEEIPVADQSQSSGDETGVRQNDDRPPNTPRWVKMVGIIILVLVLLFVILKLTGVSGDHGPGKHGSRGESTEQIDHEMPRDHTPPKGAH